MDEQFPATPATFHFSEDIERQTLSILWHEPAKISAFLAKNNPVTCFYEQHNRVILHAINLAYSELGTVDFASVVQTIKELGELERIGGRDKLNQVFEAALHSPKPDPALPHYVEMLNRYSYAREFEPGTGVYQFVGGKGTAYPVKGPENPWKPDYSGHCRVDGVKYQIKLYGGPDGQYVNVRIEPPTR